MESPYASFICICSHFCFITFLTSCFMYTHVMLILINQCLLNVAFSTTKALNSQSTLKKNFILSIFQCYLENPASLNACFLLFHGPFLFQTLLNFNWPHSSWDFVACLLISIINSKLVEIKHMILLI